MASNPLIDLLDYGQSFWLDNIRREWLRDGVLAEMVANRGLRGLTSNPAIFHKAITGSEAYDEQIATLAGEGAGVMRIYEQLVITDIRAAADVLRPVYESSNGVDGFVSLEVSPNLAHDTEGTVAQARRLFAEVDRPNVMIKVPGTPAGNPAITTLIADGIPINVTLLFSTTQYEASAEAYLAGLEQRLDAGKPIAISSVASVFLSRIDSLVDRLLGDRIVPGDEGANALQGKIAVAGAKQTYARFQALFAGPRWDRLAAAGALVQRPLWASTSTKNPLYRDVMYVEPLIGDHTVNTMPDATTEAFEDHGELVRDTITADMDRVRSTLAALERVGVDLDQVCVQLQEEGVGKFIKPFGELIAALDVARASHLGDRRLEVEVHGGALAGEISKLTGALNEMRAVERLWSGDADLWRQGPEGAAAIANRLGWLGLREKMAPYLPRVSELVASVRADGIEDVVLLGMGGSSLCAEVAATIFGQAEGFPRSSIIDTTHPDGIRAAQARLDLSKTVFVVASKSGGTLETLALYRYFRAEVEAAVGSDVAGSHFVAITDRLSGLASIAAEQGFRETFVNPSDIGGRYSALSLFGLVPMALAGLPFEAILARTAELEDGAGPAVVAAHNWAVQLGLLMAAGVRKGRPALAIHGSPKLAPVAAWLEQLIAESTGKQGTGVLPVVGEPADKGHCEGRIALVLRTAAEAEAQDESLFERAWIPQAVVTVPSIEDLGQIFLLAELATSYAGVALGVNPFDEPDVSSAKAAAKEVLDEAASAGSIQEPSGMDGADGIQYYGSGIELAAGLDLAGVLAAAAEAAGDGYLALMAYWPREAAQSERLESLRRELSARYPALVITTGFGPRLLHSIGQLYKGGPATGVFVQLVTPRSASELAVPGEGRSFDTIVEAQSLGDFNALSALGRVAIRVRATA